MGVVATRHLVCPLEVVGKELVRTIAALEMWRGLVVLSERLQLREVRTAEVTFEVVLCVLVVPPSFPRPKDAETMVTLEPRMLRFLVRVATMLCAEFAVAKAAFERGWVFGLFVRQATLVGGEFAIAIFTLEHGWVFVCDVLLEGLLGVEYLAALFTGVVVFGFPVLGEWVVE